MEESLQMILSEFDGKREEIIPILQKYKIHTATSPKIL